MINNDLDLVLCCFLFVYKCVHIKTKYEIVIDETLIASKDKNERDINKQYLNDFVDVTVAKRT